MKLDPYEELNVPRDATEDEIRKAYRERSKATHPNAGGDPADWERTSTALIVLTDPARRKTFDDTGRIDDIKVDNDRAAALNLVEMHLGQEISAFMVGGMRDREKDPRQKDLLVVIMSQLSTAIQKAEDGVEGGKIAVAFLRDMKRRFTLREASAGEDANPIARSIQRQIEHAEQQLRDIEVTIRQHEIAIEIVDGYQYERMTPVRDPYEWTGEDLYDAAASLSARLQASGL